MSAARFVVLLVALFILSAAVGYAVKANAASTGTCAVSPDPDPVGTDYTLSGSGLQPSSDYVAHLQEATHPTEQQKLDTIVVTDATGAFQVTLGYGGPRGVWTPGTVNVAIALWSGRGYNHTGKAASCSFEVGA